MVSKEAEDCVKCGWEECPSERSLRIDEPNCGCSNEGGNDCFRKVHHKWRHDITVEVACVR